MPKFGIYKDWSPAQLAHALGYRINLRGNPNGTRTAWALCPNGTEHKIHDAAYAHKLLSRVARRVNINPSAIPGNTPRALLNGAEQ